MRLQLEPTMILYFILGLVVLYIIGWFLLAPLKFLLKLSLNSVLGAVLLVLLNLIGGIFSVTIPINPLNAVIAGTFGAPGIFLLLIIKLIFH